MNGRKLILIGGDLAGGKSTFANILKEKYKLLVINKDRLKEILGDTIIVNNREDNKKLSVISFNIMKYILEKNEGALVLESNFKPKEMEELKVLINELNYSVLSLNFKGKDSILHQRFLKRLNENRHYVHKSQDFTNLNDFVETLTELRSVSYPGEIFYVDCSNFSFMDDVELYKKIEELLKK